MTIVRYCFFLAAMFWGAVMPCRAGEKKVRIGNAAAGARLDAVQRVFFRMNHQPEYRECDLHLVKLKPEDAVEKLRAGELELVIIEARDIPENSSFRKRFFAAEALMVCTGNRNPLTGLTVGQLKEIWSADRPSWRKYNGLKQDIHRLGLKFNNGGFTEARFLGNSGQNSGIFRSGNAEQAYLYCSGAALLCLPFRTDLPLEVNSLKINGVMPGIKNILAGEYPLTMHYIILMPEKNSPAAEEFLRQLFSAEIVKITRDSGLIPADAGGR